MIVSNLCLKYVLVDAECYATTSVSVSLQFYSEIRRLIIQLDRKTTDCRDRKLVQFADLNMKLPCFLLQTVLHKVLNYITLMWFLLLLHICGLIVFTAGGTSVNYYD